jgi:squalene cyclase
MRIRGLNFTFFAAILLVLCLACFLSGDEKDQPDNGPAGKPNPEITPQTTEAIQRGLEYFAQAQMKNGAINSQYPIATTSLAGLCWLASGNTPSRGKYRENIKLALKYLLRSQLKNGFIRGTDEQSGMYGHGYAALFLAEVFGMIENKELYEETKDALKKSINLLETTQNRYGGWNTAPDAQATDDGSGAIAIMQVMALRAARNAGISVKKEIIDKSKKYLLDMTTEDGWYQYNYHRRGGYYSSALTGAGMYMLGALGLYNEPKYKKGIANIMKNAPFLNKSKEKEKKDQGWLSFYYYTCFYSSLAMFQYGGPDWILWYKTIREELINKQSANGSWSGDSYGGIYSAFAILSLELAYRYLPIFQEGGKGAEGK